MARHAIIHGPEPILLEGCTGSRYWIEQPFGFTGNREIDYRLSGYPVVVFQPPNRPADQTPVVIGLQGISAPYQWSSFLIPLLTQRGIACVLFDTPFGGERSLGRKFDGEIISELITLVEKGVRITSVLVARVMEAVMQDYQTVLHILHERHGLTDRRLALFGVSLGTLLSSLAFMRDGIGERLLGTIGHADLPKFAASYAPRFSSVLASLPMRILGLLMLPYTGQRLNAGLSFVSVLLEIAHAVDQYFGVNPVHYADRVARSRRVRFLLGEADPQVVVEDAKACARQVPDGACYVVPGLAHGGEGFIEHVSYFVSTQLSDWIG